MVSLRSASMSNQRIPGLFFQYRCVQAMSGIVVVEGIEHLINTIDSIGIRYEEKMWVQNLDQGPISLVSHSELKIVGKLTCFSHEVGVIWWMSSVCGFLQHSNI